MLKMQFIIILNNVMSYGTNRNKKNMKNHRQSEKIKKVCIVLFLLILGFFLAEEILKNFVK
jgi:hypothetical protein